MKEFMIDINNILKVRSLVNISSKYDFNIELSADNFSVSAKSIIGIFTLDITKPVKVTVHSDNVDNYERYMSEIKDFILPLQVRAV